ncbi:hypothetical protein [Niastella populi]|nr:hypothetical protein [Niastella populi]
MKKIYYLIRRYEKEIVAALLGTAVVYAGWQLWPGYEDIISLIGIFITLLFTIYFLSKDRQFVFSSLTRRKDIEDWMGYGTFQLSRIKV